VAAFNLKMLVTLSLAVPVPMPWPGAHWLPSQSVIFSLHVSEGSVWAGFSINYSQNKNIKFLDLKRLYLFNRYANEGATCYYYGFYHLQSAKCKYTTNLLEHDTFLPLILFLMVSSHLIFNGSSGEDLLVEDNQIE
jgi:hypothetical protein